MVLCFQKGFDVAMYNPDAYNPTIAIHYYRKRPVASSVKRSTSCNNSLPQNLGSIQAALPLTGRASLFFSSVTFQMADIQYLSPSFRSLCQHHCYLFRKAVRNELG